MDVLGALLGKWRWATKARLSLHNGRARGGDTLAGRGGWGLRAHSQLLRQVLREAKAWQGSQKATEIEGPWGAESPEGLELLLKGPAGWPCPPKSLPPLLPGPPVLSSQPQRHHWMAGRETLPPGTLTSTPVLQTQWSAWKRGPWFFFSLIFFPQSVLPWAPPQALAFSSLPCPCPAVQ